MGAGKSVVREGGRHAKAGQEDGKPLLNSTGDFALARFFVSLGYSWEKRLNIRSVVRSHRVKK